MIVVKYKEQQRDLHGSALPSIVLGQETHESIDEVLLPRHPQPESPIYFTKKFSGHAEYRWKVVSCSGTSATASTPQTFEVFLDRRPQLHRSEYLANILKTPGNSLQRVLHRYALIEIEYGHPPVVGKMDNRIRSNKRYPDSVQIGSMPKRRLAIVNRVSIYAGRPVIQAVPISSVRPHPGDRTAVEVTKSLGTLPDYDRQSWAVTSMVETIAPTRIIAPLVRWKNKAYGRDTGFKSTLAVSERAMFRDALMCGVESESRVRDSEKLAELVRLMTQNEEQLFQLRAHVEELHSRTRYHDAYEEMARQLAISTSGDFESMRDDYADYVTQLATSNVA